MSSNTIPDFPAYYAKNRHGEPIYVCSAKNSLSRAKEMARGMNLDASSTTLISSSEELRIFKIRS